MSKEFKFDIPNTRSKQIRLLTSLILFLNGLVFLYFGIRNQHASMATNGTMAALLTLLELSIFRKKKWQLNGYATFIIGMGYYKIDAWYISILFAVLYFFSEKIAASKQASFTKKNIILKAPFTKTIEWNSLQNVVLKDGLLTLDFKNNKLLQTQILNELSEAETEQFNDFCIQHLASSK